MKKIEKKIVFVSGMLLGISIVTPSILVGITGLVFGIFGLYMIKEDH